MLRTTYADLICTFHLDFQIRCTFLLLNSVKRCSEILISLGLLRFFFITCCECLQRFLKKFWRLYHIWPFSPQQYHWICGLFGPWWWKHLQIGRLTSSQVCFSLNYILATIHLNFCLLYHSLARSLNHLLIYLLYINMNLKLFWCLPVILNINSAMHSIKYLGCFIIWILCMELISILFKGREHLWFQLYSLAVLFTYSASTFILVFVSIICNHILLYFLCIYLSSFFLRYSGSFGQLYFKGNCPFPHLQRTWLSTESMEYDFICKLSLPN